MSRQLHIFGLLNGRFITGSYLEDAIDDVASAKEQFLQEGWHLPDEEGEIEIVFVFWGVYEPKEIVT